MIGEVRSGSSFRGLTHYLLHGSAATHPKVPAWVELRNLVDQDPEAAHLEMSATAAQNPRVREPVFHLVLSPAPEDRLGPEDWLAVADRILGDLGLEEHQALLALHVDTGLPHLHLAINRVHPHSLTAWDRWRSKTRVEAVLRQIEQEWSLRVVPGRLAGQERLGAEHPLPPPLSPGEQALLHHQASEPQVLRWRRALAPHFEAARSWTDLAARLHANGVRVEARGRGLVVTDGAVHVKASRIGRAYSRARLEERFGAFAGWRKELERFDAAAGLYPRLTARSPVQPRARATARALRQSGARLGWRALSRLRGPLAPAVATLALGARRWGRVAGAPDREDARTWELLVRRQLRPAIERASSWAEAEGRLRLYGAWIGAERPSGRLLVTDGVRATPLEDLWEGTQGDPVAESLTRRLGPWSAWERSRAALVAAAGRYTRAAEEVRSPAGQADRWRRLGRVIRAAEERVERVERLGAELRAAEARVRALVDGERRGRRTLGRPGGALGARAGQETEDLLARLRATPREQIPALLSSRLRGGRLRGARVAPELMDAARRVRELSDQLRRRAAPARSARRRLPQLRRRARLLNPRQQRERAGAALVQAARPLVGIGLGSLLGRAAPGLGAAVRVVRLVGRASRRVARGRDADRDRGR